MKIYLELPEIFLSNFNTVISYAILWKDLIDGIFVPDLPLNKPTVDACAFINILNEKMNKKEIVGIQSVGHRSITANKSRMQCLKKMGIQKLLLVQGPYSFSKVNEVLHYAVERFTVGSVLNKKTLESRIKAGVKFFVTQVFPSVDELNYAINMRDFDLFLLVGISDRKEDYIKLKEKGFSVPEEIIRSTNITEGLGNYYGKVSDFLGRRPYIYLIPLTKTFDPSFAYEFIKNMQKNV